MFRSQTMQFDVLTIGMDVMESASEFLELLRICWSSESQFIFGNLFAGLETDVFLQRFRIVNNSGPKYCVQSNGFSDTEIVLFNRLSEDPIVAGCQIINRKSPVRIRPSFIESQQVFGAVTI